MKIGDYVRTENGIAKIIGRVSDPTSFYYKLWICDRYLELNDETSYIHEQDIIGEPKGSLIDLIEFGDYVNGKEVIKKHYTYMGENFIDLDTNDSWEWGIGKMPTKYIKSIVTKEQFESMEYKVVE